MQKAILTFLLFLIITTFLCCKNNKNDFEKFEITYSDGWTINYSMVIFKSGELIVRKQSKTIESQISGIILEGREFEAIKSHINSLKVESVDHACVDCPAASIEIVKDNQLSNFLQKGKQNTDLAALITILTKISYRTDLSIQESEYIFRTEDDFIDKVNFVN